MRLQFAWILVLGGVLFTGPLAAQGDAPWWRSLFPQSGVSVEEPLPDAQEDIEVPSEKEDAADSESYPAPSDDGSAFADAGRMPQGSVHWGVPVAIQGLDSLLVPEDEVRIPGFRVQLFMGRLDSARSLRHHLQDNLDLPFDVHLTRYPPVFGLQVGDFRTALAAHRAKKSLSGLFPDALVVPAELTPEEAYPVGADCIRTP